MKQKAHRPPRGKRSAWNGNQQTSSMNKIKKTADKLQFSLSLSAV
ncbi:Ribose 5-phosphate isomerase B [Bacillus badius]|uniref:Ribose 5-phosphate isomerase B n=1 Tax=Bacillus badius TaxID=1455 RepID=A0ABR5B0W7_BACBA|nr:Ribose 5-phosphate isomerase B [Bacillus badius]